VSRVKGRPLGGCRVGWQGVGEVAGGCDEWRFMAVGCCVVLCCVDMLRELAGCAYVDRMDTLIVRA